MDESGSIGNIYKKGGEGGCTKIDMVSLVLVDLHFWESDWEVESLNKI